MSESTDGKSTCEGQKGEVASTYPMVEPENSLGTLMIPSLELITGEELTIGVRHKLEFPSSQVMEIRGPRCLPR